MKTFLLTMIGIVNSLILAVGLLIAACSPTNGVVISLKRKPVRPDIHELNSDENEAKAFLAAYNKEYAPLLNKFTVATWNWETNITDYNAKIAEMVGDDLGAYHAKATKKALRFDTTRFSEETRRQLTSFKSVGLGGKDARELSHVLNQMKQIYGSFQACRDDPITGTHKCYNLEPELTDLMAQTGDYDDHLWAWKTWHEGVGRQLRPLYLRYVDLTNKQARLNGFEDYGDQWRHNYDTTELEVIVKNLYQQVEPLYKQLHAYIRRQLYRTYGAENISLTGTLPAHLLGDMWGRFWLNLNGISQPYPDKPSSDPSDEMRRQNYTVDRMFRMGDEFYRSMGLKGVPHTFWNLSMLEKPADRDVMCHATAWDFNDARDFRIRMCSRVVFEDFQTVHHELGHIQYFMQYASQPIAFREGANDGFHEAIGELMAMSVSTTKHLKAVGLLTIDDEDQDVDMNFLLFQALQTVSTLPFHLVQDTWRWKMFRGEIAEDKLNDEYWAEKARVVGVSPPVSRNSAHDLDAAAIYHVSNDYDMIRYFMRTFFQYQFAEVLCNASGHTGPLFKCDLYNSKEAGTALARMLKLGSSLPWQDAMEVLTGQREVLATPLLNYFEPLRIWLEKKNRENGEFIGWDIPVPNDECSNDTPNEIDVEEFESRSDVVQLSEPLPYSVRQSLDKIRKS